MQDHNPYAPPSPTADPPEGRGLVFSEEGALVVSSLAAWMRGLSTLYYVGLGGIVLLLSCTMLAPAPGAAKGVILGIILAVVLWLGVVATWLRSAAGGFERGVLSDDEITLGQGFRSLRAYLILTGIFSILAFGFTILGVST